MRNSTLEKAKVLNGSAPPWNKVYIKKDIHPVYREENQIIHKKMKELKNNNPDNHEIKIENGALLVNNHAVDRNSFFN